jgi:ClpP class serine protease
MHPHSLFRLSSKVYNTPHLITPASLSVILDYFDQRNVSDFQLSITEAPGSDMASPEVITGNGVGYLAVDGSLTYKPVMTMCGEAGTSYQSLVEQTQTLADSGVHTIVMEVSSGGGEASHCFQTANDIRAICDENNIQLLGYADTMACSAAYALISVCDQIVANPSADVGSVGCVVALMDTSKAMAQAGLKRIFIASGESKVPFAADGSFKEAFLDDIQATVDGLNEEFASHVSSHTGLDTKTIKGLEAKVFSAAEALKLGLINAVMTNKEFAQFVAQSTQGTQ